MERKYLTMINLKIRLIMIQKCCILVKSRLRRPNKIKWILSYKFRKFN